MPPLQKRKATRGTAKGKKKCNFKIEFDEAGEPVGENAAEFMSQIGLRFRKKIPYHKLVKDIDKRKYDEIWEYFKQVWNIPNDHAKRRVLRNAKRNMKNFRSYLVRHFVNKDRTPFEEYDCLDRKHWDYFVKKTKSKEYKEKSIKAKLSAAKNTAPACLGRGGYRKLMNEWNTRWDQLVSSNPDLSHVENDYTKLLMLSKAHLNPVTKLYELRSHLSSEEGALKGKLKELRDKEKEMKASGSTKSLFPRLKNRIGGAERLPEGIDAMQRDQVYDLPQIEFVSGCELKWPFETCDSSFPDLVLGRGQVYPERILHNLPIADDFVKVHVDLVYENMEKQFIHPKTKTEEVTCMGDTKGQFIQWPRKFIKILNTGDTRPSMSAQQPPRHSDYGPEVAYVPKFDATCMWQQQKMMPLQGGGNIYQEDESFLGLLNHMDSSQSPHVDCNRSEPIPSSHPNVNATEKISEGAQIITSLLKDIENLKKPPSIYNLANKLANVSKSIPIRDCVSPNGMFKDNYTVRVDMESLIKLCANQWADITVMSWFMMYLYIIGDKNGKTAYFNPQYIEPKLCEKKSQFVKAHIQSVLELHKNRQYFMAPLNDGIHWSLVMIGHTNEDWNGYIIDSAKKGKKASSFVFTTLFEKVIGKEITWQMVNCHQQTSTWECGYYVMMAMFEFVVTCKEHLVMNDPKPHRLTKIDDFIEFLLGQFMRFFM